MHKFVCYGYFAIVLLILGCHAPMPKDIDMTIIKGRIAIAPLEAEDKYRNYSSLFRNTLFTELAHGRRLNLVERDQIDKAIEELKINRSDFFDTKTAVRIGKFVSAEYMLVGTLASNPAAEERFTINVRLILVEKAEVVNGWSVDTSEKELTKTARTMAGSISLYPPYTPGSTTLASTFIPGSGQLLNKRKSGYVFLPAGLLSALGVGLTQSALVSAQKEQYNAMKLSAYQRLGKDVDDKRRIRNITLYIAGAVWLINVIDTYLESRLEVQKYYQAIKPHPYSEP